jgi:polysaccharide pyruvyl transferase CsaB
VPKLFLLGYFGAGNFGDDALLTEWLKRHRALLEAKGYTCDLLSRSPRPLQAFAQEAQLMPLLGRIVTRSAAWQLNCGDYAALVVPGGSLLQDKTSLRSLLFYLSLIRRFRKARRPVFLLHQGIGPLGRIGSWLTARVLPQVNYLSLRDRGSYDWSAKHLQGRPELALSADPILTAQFDLPEFTQVKPQLPYALLIPKRTGALPTREDAMEEIPAIASTLETLSRNSGLRTLIAALHPEQDEDFCRRIAEASAHAGFAVPQVPTANHFWGLIGQSSLVISYRLHGLIAAAACNVPGFGVAYDPKVSSFCEEIGFPWCYPAEIHSSDTNKKLLAYSTRLEAEGETLPQRRTALAAKLEAANARFAELLAGLA